MATKKKIAEQILRIVQGGNVSDDSSIDIREVMALIDQERDAIIKREIMNRVYAKSTTTNSAELEITGDWLTNEVINVYNNSYGILNNSPINLPNDLGLYRVEAIGKTYNKQKTNITITTGVTEPNTISDLSVLQFSAGPIKLDSVYRISFTFTEGGNEHKISLNVKTINNDKNFYNTQNIAQSILNSPDFNKFLNDFDLKNSSYNTGDDDDNVGVSGLYSFSISDVKINGKESEDSSHGFTFSIQNQATTFTQSNISDTQLKVIINDSMYVLPYSNEDYGATSTGQVATNFVDKFSTKIAMEKNISVTNDDNIIIFEEMESMGGFNISTSNTGELATSISTVTASSMSSKFQKRRVLTRMPSGGGHNNMYHNLAVKSGREFYYIEGNRVYLYKNNKQTLSLNVNYIATSRSIGSDDYYPIPADYEKEIIVNTVNLFGLMKKAREDLVNDNIG
tara:strand:- start:34222 stop:35580 length:1359 start_codon:yes stop_codon:yes gene_type:complete